VSYLAGVRRKNLPDVRRYVELMRTDPDAIVVEEESLDPSGRASETAIQMLRLTEGIDRRLFRQLTGFDAQALFARQIEHFTGLGLMSVDPASIRLTRRGMLVSNQVMLELLSTGSVHSSA